MSSPGFSPSSPLAPDQQHGAVRLWVWPTGPLQENTILIAGQGGQGFLIDPGDEPRRLLELVKQSGVQVQAILLTHAHFDHIGAVQPLREALGVPVYLHPTDLPLYEAAHSSAARWNLPFVQPAAPEHPLSQGQTLRAGDLRLMVRELPGHSPGHVIFVAQSHPDDAPNSLENAEMVVLAGDTLFAGSIGRTDLPGGHHQTLLDGIARELLPLPDQTAVYPGHGGATTIGREKKTNPFLR